MDADGTNLRAYDINESGAVAGQVDDRAALWQDGRITLLTSFEEQWAAAINDAGTWWGRSRSRAGAHRHDVAGSVRQVSRSYRDSCRPSTGTAPKKVSSRYRSSPWKAMPRSRQNPPRLSTEYHPVSPA